MVLLSFLKAAKKLLRAGFFIRNPFFVLVQSDEMTGSFDVVEQWESGIVSDCEQQSSFRCYLPFGLDIAEYAMVDFRC